MNIYECVSCHWEVIRFFGRGDSVSWHHFVVLTDTRSHLEDWWLLAKHKICDAQVSNKRWSNWKVNEVKEAKETRNLKIEREFLFFALFFLQSRNPPPLCSTAGMPCTGMWCMGAIGAIGHMEGINASAAADIDIGTCTVLQVSASASGAISATAGACDDFCCNSLHIVACWANGTWHQVMSD